MDRKELLTERRRIKKRAMKLERSLRSHEMHLAKRRADPSYCIGKYVTDLGTAAVGACMIVDDCELRRAIHEAIRRAYAGGWPEDAVLCHRCDTPHCTEPQHIFPGTHQDNMRDCALKGRWSKRVGARKEELASLRVRLLALELALGGVNSSFRG